MSDHFEFEIKRLVLVDSAGFCYVDLPLDDHAILLGDGNLGKSSLLNSLRLFLLPENNFKNSKNKFAFATPKRDGYYDNDESYAHYFPSKFSSLILEVSNNIGGSIQTHCQILNKSTERLGYQRIFTPLPYQKILHLFWDAQSDDDHIGYRVDKLTSIHLFDALKALDKRTISVKDSNKLKTLLYANDFTNVSAMRYSIFPLAESDEARIESLRTLILLLFDMNASSEPVATAVGNIIEADKKFVEDILDFNIAHFFDRHNDLKQQEIELLQLENLTDKYQQLCTHFKQYTELADSELKFATFYKQLQQASNAQLALRNSKAAELGEAQKTENEQKRKCKNLSNKNRELGGEIKSITRQLSEAQEAVEKAERLLDSYPDTPLDEVLEFFTDDINENRKNLAALESESQKAERIDELKENIQQNEREMKIHETQLENQHFSLKQQLPENCWQITAAVNKKLAMANPTRQLSKEEIASFTHFTDLFDQDSDSVSLYNELFLKQSGDMVRNDEQIIRKLNSQIKEDQGTLKQLEKGYTNPLIRADEIKVLKRNLNQAEKEKEYITQLDFNRKNKDKLKPQLTDAEALFTENTKLMEQEQSTLELYSKKHETLDAQWSQLQAEVKNSIELEKRCKHMMTRQPRLAQAIENKSIEADFQLNNEELTQLELNLWNISDLGHKLLNGLRDFISKQVIKDEKNVMAESPDPDAINETFKMLTDTFSNLPGRKRVLAEQVRTHNESVQGYANILQKNHEHIKRFEKQLNRDFAEIEINDLNGIEVDIHIDKRFENLVTDIVKLDLQSDSMLPDNFYARLQNFAQNFFKEDVPARLTMDKIVNNISYRTRKKDQTAWQTKQQSNSTTALINLKLVQILLRKLRANGCSLMFPLVLDEVATVDVNQFDWLLDDIKKSGFNLFAASTHSASPELIYKIGRHHELGEMRTAKPYSIERTMVYWGGAEYFTNQHIVQTEQFGLLEATDEQTV